MFLSYGAYQHGLGECNVAIDRVTIDNEAGLPLGTTETWTIGGMLLSQVGPADLDAKIAALMAAYQIHGQDLILHLPDGSASSSQLISANTLSGTRVTQRPSFPSGQNSERVMFAHYTIKLEAEIVTQESNLLVDYHESIKLHGGVPAIGWLEPAVGLPIQQTWKQFTTFKVTQEGHATGYQWQPAIGFDVGVPIWPVAMLPQQTELNIEAPDRIGENYKNWKVSWHYEFESLTPLIGNATPWPLNL